ncbi:hypothetical protein HR51_11435 [Burkholderia cepacia]|nr:hypothetical protein HR51_11435 [Burkholderia cepacia]
MNALGIVSESSTRNSARKPPFIPSFGFHEVHESKPIDAAPARIIDTVTALDMRTDPVVNALLNIREFPGTLAASLHRDETSLSLGLVGRFWRPELGVLPIADAAAFIQHDDPRDAKLVLRFEVVGLASGAHMLRTETFVHCPTARTRLLFMPYWLTIRMASGWIRRRTLTAVEMALA